MTKQNRVNSDLAIKQHNVITSIVTFIVEEGDIDKSSPSVSHQRVLRH